MTHERVTIAPKDTSDDVREAILERARKRGFTHFAAPEGAPFEARPGEVVVLRGEHRLTIPGPAPRTVPLVSVGEPEALDTALRATPDGGILAVEWTGDRVIPLENAIAVVAGRFELWVVARGPHEVSGALGALEHGADRVIVTVDRAQEVDELERLLEGPLSTGLDWTIAPVSEVKPAGIGDRVLVDTTSLLEPSEGLLVGSAASFLFHVASEAVGSQFSRPRPFRVNAGAAHSYVLMSDGTTRYLAELEAGDRVLVSRPAGPVRSVRVGRIKIERRPMIVVRADVGDTSRTVFLQEAETVRLSTDAGRVPTTELAAGVRAHGVRLAPARHLGRQVQETILER